MTYWGLADVHFPLFSPLPGVALNYFMVESNVVHEKGLLGLFIWAIDQDDDDHSALNAVLHDRGGLGSFTAHNGVGSGRNTTDWVPVTGTCFLGDCDARPSCPGVTQAIGPDVRFSAMLWVNTARFAVHQITVQIRRPASGVDPLVTVSATYSVPVLKLRSQRIIDTRFFDRMGVSATIMPIVS